MLLDYPKFRRTLSAELVAGCGLACPARPGKKRGQPFRITQSQLREVAVNISPLAPKIKLLCLDSKYGGAESQMLNSLLLISFALIPNTGGQNRYL
jgi:hypothetical protein